MNSRRRISLIVLLAALLIVAIAAVPIYKLVFAPARVHAAAVPGVVLIQCAITGKGDGVIAFWASPPSLHCWISDLRT
jgi:hypothetical protein